MIVTKKDITETLQENGLWDNIRANKGSGKKPTKEILEQERKINKVEI